LVEAELLLAPIQAEQGYIEQSVRHIESALAAVSLRRELIPSFVHATMAVAKHDHNGLLAGLLAKHELGRALEPLTVALQLARGEEPIVAKEVMEVAKDIVERA
jgi:hypothetical protein